MIRDDLFESLYEDLIHAPVIDTHEHLPPRESLRDQRSDILSEYLSHYMSSDLVSSGLSLPDLTYARDAKKPLEKRWRVVEPYWQACRMTGYARALDLSVRTLYQVDGIQRHTLVPLNEKFIQARQPGRYREVIRDICKIETCINDDFYDLATRELPAQSSLFCRTWRPDSYYYACPPQVVLNRKATAAGRGPVRRLNDLLELLDLDFARLEQESIHILKIGIAYARSLDFPQVSPAQAGRSFAAFLDRVKKEPDQTHLYPLPVQNFMMHQILQRAEKNGLIIQVHTGLQEGNGNILANSQPLLLAPLLLAYPRLHFDLFHIGYPFIGETCALAKNFPNVSINMCWSHIIAPSAAQRALAEFLDAVPANKISAFGGDYLFVDGIVGHLQLARENVAHVLADKVRLHQLDQDQAIILGRNLFYHNPKAIFRL